MSKAAPAAGNSAANTFEDKQILTEFIQYKTTNTLVHDGFKPDGTGGVDKGHAFRLSGIKNRQLLFGELAAIPLH